VKVRTENLSGSEETQPATEIARVWMLAILMDSVWPSNSELPLVEKKNLALAMAEQYFLVLAKSFASSPGK
jgi:hypothetical protein